MKYSGFEKDLIIIPKSKVFVNRNELLNLTYLAEFDFPTTNLFYTSDISYEKIEIIAKNKAKNQMLDIDLENSDYKVTEDFLDLCFQNQTRYLTFQSRYLSEKVFEYLLKWLLKDKNMDYFEFHGLDEARLTKLLEILKKRP